MLSYVSPLKDERVFRSFVRLEIEDYQAAMASAVNTATLKRTGVECMAQKYYYNYAVVDPVYPGEPQFWGLTAISLGDAAKIQWTSDFAPDADATTELLLSNLHRQRNKITLAIPNLGISSTEPKWKNGMSYDQLLIEVASDASYGVKRKLVFYHIQVLSVKQTNDRKLGGPATIILCQVGRGGYVVGRNR